jgi:hypothetical protein
MKEQNLLKLPNLNPFSSNASGRLSYSTLETLYTCERKYQLEHLLVNGIPRGENEHFSFGHCIGDGIAHYMVHQDREAALASAWLSYWPQIETDKKNQAKAIVTLEVAFNALDNVLQDYEVVFFEGKPAVELSFRLNVDDFYYYAGHIDIVVRNKWTGKYFIFEVKTTGLDLHDISPLYANSGQALGYSIILDRIVGEEVTNYGVLYCVCQLGKGYTPQVKILPFEKNLLDRLNWFMSLGMDVERLKRMEELGVYPKRGGSCLQYMRPCAHFNVCGLHGLDKSAGVVEDKEEYQFVYQLDELVEDHINRLSSELVGV